MEDQELTNCTYVKVFLMAIILIYHSLLLSQGVGLVHLEESYVPSYFKYIIDWFSSFQNYAFVLVSGYVFGFIVYERGGYSSFSELLQKKAKRLMIPYFFIGLFWMVPTAVLFYKRTLGEVLIDWALGIDPHQLWFLLMLFEVFLVSYLLLKFYERRPLLSYSFLVLIYFLGVLFQIYFINIYRVFNAMQMLFFFRLGIDLRKRKIQFLQKINLILYFILHILFFAITEITNYSNSYILKILGVGFGFLTRIIGCLTAFFFFQSFSTFLYQKGQHLNKIAKVSMPVFLLHQQVMCIIVTLINGRVCIFLSALIVFFLGVIVSVFISLICLHFKLTRVIVGEYKSG